jgi:hypothetical protein
MKYLNTAEVGEILRKTPEWVAQQCKAGNLRATKLGNDWRIDETALVAFMSGPVPTARKRLSARQARRAS